MLVTVASRPRESSCRRPSRGITLVHVFALVFGMMICLALALAVVGLVAVPARREGREVLTSRGEELVGAVRDRTHRCS